MTKKKILIIDDEADFCALLKKNIEKSGEYEVHVATGGEEGIESAKLLKPDLILLDIIMPDIDGGDVLARIREYPDLEDTPIVFLTAMVREKEAAPQASFTTGYALLSKTATILELMDCIKKNVRHMRNID